MSGLEEQEPRLKNTGKPSPGYRIYMTCTNCGEEHLSWKVIVIGHLQPQLFFNVTDAYLGPGYNIMRYSIEEVDGFKCTKCRTIYDKDTQFYDMLISLMRISRNIWMEMTK